MAVGAAMGGVVSVDEASAEQDSSAFDDLEHGVAGEAVGDGHGESVACRAAVWVGMCRVEEVVDVRVIKWRHLPGIETQGMLLMCPRCGDGNSTPMDKVVSERDQRVVMDVCNRCRGVWLDYGELEAIQQKGMLSALGEIVRLIRLSQPR